MAWKCKLFEGLSWTKEQVRLEVELKLKEGGGYSTLEFGGGVGRKGVRRGV